MEAKNILKKAIAITAVVVPSTAVLVGGAYFTGKYNADMVENNKVAIEAQELLQNLDENQIEAEQTQLAETLKNALLECGVKPTESIEQNYATLEQLAKDGDTKAGYSLEYAQGVFGGLLIILGIIGVGLTKDLSKMVEDKLDEHTKHPSDDLTM